jgi:hypothetical protein
MMFAHQVIEGMEKERCLIKGVLDSEWEPRKKLSAEGYKNMIMQIDHFLAVLKKAQCFHMGYLEKNLNDVHTSFYRINREHRCLWINILPLLLPYAGSIL